MSFAWLAALNQRSVIFATRIKAHSRVRVEAARPARAGSGVDADQTIETLGQAAR